MTQSNLIFAAYLLVGFVGLLAVCRKFNGPLSIADLVVCAVTSFAWPGVLAVFVVGSAFATNSWFTRKRF